MGEERMNQDDVLDVINVFPLEPLFGKVFITLNKAEEDGVLIFSDNVLDDVQYVVAGEIQWKNIKVSPGQKVIIDIERMMVATKSEDNNAYEAVMQVKVDLYEIDGVPYALIDERLIKAKDNR
jgi:hypothetical protein